MHRFALAIDALSNRVIATLPIGQAAQAVTYVPNVVPEGDGLQGLQPLGVAGEVAHRRERRSSTPSVRYGRWCGERGMCRAVI